ncbi:hypothetical protein GCM10009104_24490 [Marinobacterium maritimum]|uniref:Cell division protein ZapB n=2 Tax=Marinobacterium maritimum TaxID=500162 RepID=A0ABN1I7T7_9GAMM
MRIDRLSLEPFDLAPQEQVTMQSGLFTELESKIEGLIEEVELLRLEVSELRQAKQSLEEDRSQNEQSLQRLLGKFERLQESENL